MALKGVELEVTDGITEHSSRVALKAVFSNFGDVVACWVPPIDRRGLDRASVRFGASDAAEAAKTACDAGQVFLQGMMVKCGWRTGGGRRVGNSDLGKDAGGNSPSRQGGQGGGNALKDGRRRSRSRRRRSRSRGRRSRSGDRREKRFSRSRGRDKLPPLADMQPPVDPSGLPDWLRDVDPSSGPAPGQAPPALVAPAVAALTGYPAIAPNPMGAAPFDPEEDARRREEIVAKRKEERAAQIRRAPGVAELVQVAIQRARDQPAPHPKRDDAAPPQKVARPAPVQQVNAESDEESEDEATKTKRQQLERQRAIEAQAEAARLQVQQEIEAKEREKREQENRERREKARREAMEAEKVLQMKEAETREVRIKASVEAAKRQQAERAAAKAAKDAANNLYNAMPEPDQASEKQLHESRMKEAVQREKQNNLSSLPPEDRSKVIFLDIDGVLRPARAGGFDIFLEADASTRVDTSDFFPSAMKALRHILEKTGASLVLTSEWRRSEALCGSLKDVFDKYRLRPWGGATINTLDLETGADPLKCFAERRAKEVTHYLQENEKDVNGWVVLDDINIAMLDEAKKAKGQANLIVGPRLVQTWPLCGLTMGNAKTAVRILNGEMINKVVVERQVGAAGAVPKASASKVTTFV